MTRINGAAAIAEVDEVEGEALPVGAQGEGNQALKMIAHCNAFFARRGMTINEGGFFSRQPRKGALPHAALRPGKRTKPFDFGLRKPDTGKVGR